MAFIYSLQDTWNDGATTFTAIRMNVQDTASAAASNLLDLQVGGVSQFNVSKTGALVLASSFNNSGLVYAGIHTGATETRGFRVGSANGYGFSSTTVSTGTPDLILARDAANALAQRNGVNAQAFRVYNTFTDASNYERGVLRWNTNILQIGTEAAGTGTVRSVQVVAGSTSYFFNADEVAVFPATGSLQFNGRARIASPALGIVRLTEHNGTNAGALELPEWAAAPAAPATNNVRIYAEDNGSGKTRLMARFATGAAVQIAIEP
jgi:hypothetical protein